MTSAPATATDLETLNALLRGELSAVETYGQAIIKVQDRPLLRTTLQQCQVSHQRRCSRLESEIRSLGSTPKQSSGIWGGFAKLVEGGAMLFGASTAVSALEEGELHGIRTYQDAIENRALSARVRNLVACELLQEQRATYKRITSFALIVDQLLHDGVSRTHGARAVGRTN